MKKRFETYWNKRSPRERLILQAAVLILAGVLFDRVALAPTRAATAQLRAERVQASEALDRVHQAIDQQMQQGQSIGQQRLDALAQRRQRAEAVIAQAQAELISPRQMQRQLAAILQRFPQMHVVALNTLAPVQIGVKPPPHDGAATLSASTTTTPPADSHAPLGLYQHGLEITVEGRYLDLIGYLEALDHAPYRVYWRDLALTVDASKGIPVTRIDLFTLSREATWLSL